MERENMRENVMTRQTCNIENYIEHRNNKNKKQIQIT